MVNCQGCGEETVSRLCCPKCSEYGRTSFFCSQDCFVSSWPSHSKLHVIIRQIALSNNASSYEATRSLNAEDTAAASPATTAASVSANGEESFLGKKVQPASTGAQSVEPRSRSRVLSRAGSETELPVVTSSAASSSFSHVSSAAETSSSLSSSSRGGSYGPPALSPVGLAAADGETVGHSVPPSASPDDGSGAGGVFTAVRSLLLPKMREKTEEKTPGNRPAAASATAAASAAAAASATAAAVRVSQAMRSVFSTSHNRHHAVPCSNRKKDMGRALPGREGAPGRAGAASSSAAVPPPGVGFCRCVMLVVICTFSLFFMWMMRRILFDASGSPSAYYSSRPEALTTPNRSEALSDSDDIISAVLARIGARPYGEEISALQASVQDIRNELAAVTTLVQQHGAVIDQFVDKPNFSGRRQGGSAGGAINQAISAFLEGGPPLPDTPRLKLPTLRPSAGVFTRKGAAAGLSETAQQEAVATPHAAVPRDETLAAAESGDVGMSPQKFYEANVAVEGDRVKSRASGQQSSSKNIQAQQPQEDGRRQEHASEHGSGEGRFNGVSAAGTYLTGSLVNAAVKSASRLSAPGDKVYEAKSESQPSEGNEASVETSGLYVGGNTEPSNDVDIGRGEQREQPTHASDTQASQGRSAPTYNHAPGEEKDEEGEWIQSKLGEKDQLGSTDSEGSQGDDRSAKANVGASGELLDRQLFRGKGDRQQEIRRKEGEEKEKSATSHGHQEEQGHMNEPPQSRSFVLAGVRGRNSKRVKSN